MGGVMFCALWLISSSGPPMSSLGFTTFAPQKSSSSSSLGTQMDLSVAALAPYTAAVVYMLTTLPHSRPKETIFRSLSLLQKSVPWRHHRPVLLFHAGLYDSGDNQMTFLHTLRNYTVEYNLSSEATEALLERIEFVHLQHDVPEGIPHNTKEYKPVWREYWPSYHHMCAFFSYKIFRHPRVRDLTYYLRLGDDSFIQAPTCFDPFEYMHINDKSFAFRVQDMDEGSVTAGMWPFVSDYAYRYPEVEDRLRSNRWSWAPKRLLPGYGTDVGFPGYGGDFEIVRLARFQTPEVTAFLKELASEPKRFYYSRWGDAPLRRATVYMFLNVTEEVHQMCEVEYASEGITDYPMCECAPLPRLT
ncbi:nucleotide-diphospho-sugar transferase [Mycena metata]|uniref:Nucleotide-diphospho-sugar transferase n=1 Tax=Mycena metata TaxID=1033252 RepID=A0AAD7J4S6_9AGAR|nr:nucleotide-diphospho-sugar transferase [Mycena metata]